MLSRLSKTAGAGARNTLLGIENQEALSRFARVFRPEPESTFVCGALPRLRDLRSASAGEGRGAGGDLDPVLPLPLRRVQRLVGRLHELVARHARTQLGAAE